MRSVFGPAFGSARQFSAIVTTSFLLTSLMAPTLIASSTHAAPIAPPPTRVDEIQPSDPYRWLETDTPERQTWIRRQNRASKAFLKERKSRAWFEDFFRKLNNKPTTRPMFKSGEDVIAVVNEGLGKPVKVTKTSPNGTSTTLFNTHEDKHNGSVAFVGLLTSPDNRYLIAATVGNGSTDDYTLHVIDPVSGQRMEKLENAISSRLAWTSNDEFIYGLRYGQEGLAIKHKIGRDTSEDTLFSKDPKLEPSNKDLGGGLGGDKWIFLASETSTRFKKLSSSTWFSIDLKITDAVGLVGDDLYHLTNREKGRGQVEKIHLDPSVATQKSEVVIPQGAMAIKSASVQGQNLVILSQMGATQKVTIATLDGKAIRDFVVPTSGTVSFASYDATKDRLTLSMDSLIKSKDFVYDFATRTFLNGYPDQVLYQNGDVSYVSDIAQVSSANGTQVPVRITYKKGLKLDGDNPAVIEGYGGFGIAGHFDSFADAVVREFMNRGGVYIGPALRGGNELGGPWHTDGMGSRKQNVFNDLIATAEYVIQRGYTSSSRLAVMGASNGGLLVSAVATQRPDLFRLAIPIAGVHDMLRKERLDPEFDGGWSYEYGNTDIVADYKTLLAYSPLHNLKKQAYPTFLIVVGESDSRVNPAHSYKLAGALQSFQTGPNPILLTSTKNAGHFLKSITRHGLIGWRTMTSIWSTIFDELGVDTDPQGTLDLK